MPKKIYVWGVDPQGLQMIRDQVAEWAEIVELVELPDHGPDSLLIVAHNQEFIEWAEARTMVDESQPRPVLVYVSYVSSEEEIRQCCDGLVGENYRDWLEAWLECDYVFEASLMGSDVPASFLRELGDRQFSQITIAEIPFGDTKWASQDSPCGNI